MTISVKQMVKELERAGWKRWEGRLTVWESPKGYLFRGPAKAHEVMLKDWARFL